LRKGATASVEVVDNILNHLAEFTVQKDRIISMYPGYKVRTFSNVHLIVLAPFHPFVVFIKVFHLLTASIARATSFSW